MSKPRISDKEYQIIKNEYYPTALSRREQFNELVEMSDRSSIEGCNDLINNIILEQKFDLTDILLHQKGDFWLASNSDTHVKNRLFEGFAGGRCDGLPIPDREDGEIKLVQVVKDHELEQILNIGKIQPIDSFEESSCYHKLKKMLIATYLQEGKQLGRKLVRTFIFKINKTPFYDKIKEDWEYYYKEYLSSQNNPKKASGKMKSDAGIRCPNHTLGIRSDSIIITKKSFSEISKYYANI